MYLIKELMRLSIAARIPRSLGQAFILVAESRSGPYISAIGELPIKISIVHDSQRQLQLEFFTEIFLKDKRLN